MAGFSGKDSEKDSNEKRVFIAALFLPVTCAKGKEQSLVDLPLSLPPTDEPTSLIASVAAASIAAGRRLSYISSSPYPNLSNKQPPKFMKDSSNLEFKPIDHSTVEFYSSNIGNPGLYNALNSSPIKVTWVGTFGLAFPTDHLDDEERSLLTQRVLRQHDCCPVYVTADQMRGHYHQMSKQILWKPFHYQLPDYPKPKGFEKAAWKYYCEVNELFAKKIAEHYRPGDVVWVNDYHLMLVPRMVREMIPEATIGFFLHIPFPSSEIFRSLSARKEILNGLLASDLIGFQVHSFMRHFLMTCSRLLGLDSTPKAIQLDNSTVAVGSYPIGIDLAVLEKKRKEPPVLTLVEVLKEKYAGKLVLIGRDKNDYVKGVRHKLLSFERFLQDHPEMQGKVVLIQVSLPTSELNESQSNVSNVVERINSHFGTIEYVPVVYLQQDISFEYYLALLTIADACLITSLRDGMNLTSHEYVVCQEAKKSPLIISEFAGTYGNFGAALRVNPWNTQEVADTIYEALVMNDEDRAYRWKFLYSYVKANTSSQFVNTFLSDLVARHEENLLSLSTRIPRLTFDPFIEAYNFSNRRIILLDDDGTLQKPLSSPKDDLKLIKLLKKLCADEANSVYLMSSHSRAELQALQTEIPNLGISAESGCFVRFANRAHWETLFHETDISWRKKVLEIFEYYTDRTPGSYIEEKEIGIAWHYEFTDTKYGEWQAAECQNHMTVSLPNFPIHIIARKKCLEVYLRNVSKATAIRRIFEHHRHKQRRSSLSSFDRSLGGVALSPINREEFTLGNNDDDAVHEFCDFVLCIGDDRADEYMFQYIRKITTEGASALDNGVSFQEGKEDLKIITCTVGSKSSAARYYLPSYSDVLTFLFNIK